MNDRTDINEKLSHGNIAHLLRKMEIPGVISQILLLLYNMVDRIYLGRMNDGGAARAMIRLGSGKRDEAEEIMGNSVVSIILSGAVLTAVLYIFAKPIMYFLGASDVSIGAVAIMGYMGILQFIISQGATRQAMIYVVWSFVERCLRPDIDFRI